jgi:hypothetical protein
VLEKEVHCGRAIARTQRLWNVFSRWRSGAVSTQFSHPQSSRLNTRVLYSLPLDTSGSEREPKLWPNTHFRRQPNAAAADLRLFATSSSSEGAKDKMAHLKIAFLFLIGPSEL